MLQWEEFPSRVEAGDGDNQLVDAGRNGMPRVVGEMGDCGGMEGVGWLQMRTHASCVLCLLARDRKFRRSLSEGQAIMADGWRHQRRLAHRRHHPITKRTVTSRLHFTHRLVLPHEPGWSCLHCCLIKYSTTQLAWQALAHRGRSDVSCNKH